MLRSSTGVWNAVPQGPPDAVFGVNDAFKKDTSPRKVNLSIGAYRDESGKPWVLPSIRLVCSSSFGGLSFLLFHLSSFLVSISKQTTFQLLLWGFNI